MIVKVAVFSMLISSAIHYFYISSNISISLRNSIISSTSQFFHSSVLMSPCTLCFFLLFLHWGQSCRQCFIDSIWFPQVGCWSFLVIKMVMFYITILYFFFCCHTIGDNVWLSVFGFHMLHFCILIVDYFLISNVHGLV